MQELRITQEDAQDRTFWKSRIRAVGVADPTLIYHYYAPNCDCDVDKPQRIEIFHLRILIAYVTIIVVREASVKLCQMLLHILVSLIKY